MPPGTQKGRTRLDADAPFLYIPQRQGDAMGRASSCGRVYSGISVKPQRYSRLAGRVCHGSGREPQLS